MKRHEIAENQFMEGYRCSQAVMGAFAEAFNMDHDLAHRISLALAGGSGVGGECGAVSGAYLVIGLKYGFAHPGDMDRFQVIIDKNLAFVEKFKAIHGNIDCPKLINLNLFSVEGHQKFVENNIKETTCKQFVGDAVKILEHVLAD